MDKILIIDDSLLQARALSNILKEEYEIAYASRGMEGIIKAIDLEPCLVLLDVIMPDMDGFRVLKELKREERTKDIPVIMITGLTDTGNEEKSLTMGAVDYITKPFHPLVAKARVHTHIQLYNYQRQIKRMAMFDELTGIPNRRSYEERSYAEWIRAIRCSQPISIAVLDIDYFKIFNDTYGHLAGDGALVQVAKAISGSLKHAADFSCRYGGEEFVVLIPENSAETAYYVTNRIRRTVENLKIPFDTSEIIPYVTVSGGGVTVVPDRGKNFSTYLKIADTMLYDAKRQGRNVVVWHNKKKAVIHKPTIMT